MSRLAFSSSLALTPHGSKLHGSVTHLCSINPIGLCTRSIISMTTSTSSNAKINNDFKAMDVNPARTVVITGASGGIGAETCKGLIRTLPNLEKLILCCRDVPKTGAVVEKLKHIKTEKGEEESKLSIDIVEVNLNDSTSIIKCTEEVKIKLDNKPLDLFICNAGIMASPLMYSKAVEFKQDEDATKINRIEQQYFVNFISHALMIDKLFEDIRKSNCSRIVLVSSLAVAISRSRISTPLIIEKNSNNVTEANYSRWNAYGDSKLAMSLYSKALASKFNDDIECVSLHPGVVQTELGRYILPKWMQTKGALQLPQFISKLFGLLTPEEGAALTIELSSMKPGALKNGELYVGLGGKLAARTIIPLIENEEAVDKLYRDTSSFVQSLL